MQCAKRNAACRWLADIGGGLPLIGNSLWHARWADWKAGDRCSLGVIASSPSAPGSGKLGSPCERMQRANASPGSVVAAVPVGFPDDPHAAIDRPHANASKVARARSAPVTVGTGKPRPLA
jgi:hypothetical protein